ncbi:hypothetical protein BJL95_04605 [Methylomonas sp. LWB]|nr:hypothetical protein BJL95_04605 [Methylomonas sp. LWB]
MDHQRLVMPAGPAPLAGFVPSPLAKSGTKCSAWLGDVADKSAKSASIMTALRVADSVRPRLFELAQTFCKSRLT